MKRELPDLSVRSQLLFRTEQYEDRKRSHGGPDRI